MKYRRKPEVVEAFRFDSDAEITSPKWFGEAVEREEIYIDSCINDGAARVYGCTINGSAGRLKAKNGDYIVRDESGKIFPVSKTEFKKHYERT